MKLLNKALKQILIIIKGSGLLYALSLCYWNCFCELPRISRTLGARSFIVGTVIEAGVVYPQTGNESLPVGGRGDTYD